jgi:hypothetical protein
MQANISEELMDVAKIHTLDIAIAGQKLDQLALAKGGETCAYTARQRVKRLEYDGLPTIEAIRDVFRLVANDKL